ncbi:MAG: sugar phosphate isomerase/epimerase [Clostridiales bacterium]|nr:sugar phosphate isomerase/epimerase [Clostridiales bacterium]
MILSIENFLFREKFGEEIALKMIKDAGFGGVDYSFNNHNQDGSWGAIDLTERKKVALQIKSLLDKYGLKCNQSHAPFYFEYGDKMDLEEKSFLDLVHSIEVASIIGAKIIVIHAIKVPNGVDFYDYNHSFYKALQPYAENCGIKIAVENLVNSKFWTPQELCAFIKKLNSPVFTGCVDVGHSAIVGVEPEDFILGMDKEMVGCVHLHDTDGKIDRHWIPYQGNHNWEKIIRSLLDCGFKGDMNLEVIHSFDNLPEKLYQPMLNYIALVGKELIDKFNEYKTKVK